MRARGGGKSEELRERFNEVFKEMLRQSKSIESEEYNFYVKIKGGVVSFYGLDEKSKERLHNINKDNEEHKS